VPRTAGSSIPVTGVDNDFAATDGAPEDHPQRHQRIPDRARRQTLGNQAIGEVLHVD
jgi:hypothetical protein